MKPGDKVWVFDSLAQEIKDCTIVGYRSLGNIKEWTICFNDDPEKVAFYGFRDIELFPTREALCEHYRKIFE